MIIAQFPDMHSRPEGDLPEDGDLLPYANERHAARLIGLDIGSNLKRGIVREGGSMPAVLALIIIG